MRDVGLARHPLLGGQLAVVLFLVQVLLELFGGHSPVDLIALGLALGFASLL